MRLTITVILLISMFLTACGSSAPSANSTDSSLFQGTADTQPATTTPNPTETIIPKTPTPTITATAVPDPRWFWAVSNDKNEVLAFNAQGEVNSILDTTSITKSGNDLPPIRMSDNKAIIFFVNGGIPKAFMLTSDSATPIKFPNVRATYPENGWVVQAIHLPYLALASTGTSTAPVVLVNGETGNALTLALNVLLDPTQSNYFVRFSEDGKWARFATGDQEGNPASVHNFNLETGKDTIIFESKSPKQLRADIFGDVWYDRSSDTGMTADGKPVAINNPDYVANLMPLPNAGFLAVKYECAQPCLLNTVSPTGSIPELTFTVPVNLITQQVTVTFAQLLDQNKLLIGIRDFNSEDTRRTLFLLSSDGKSVLLGKSLDPILFPFAYKMAGLSQDSRYIFFYPNDTPSSFGVYDLNSGKALFTESLVSAESYLYVDYFNEGILVEEQDITNRHWVFNFATKSVYKVLSPAGDGYCTALTTDARPICQTDTGVLIFNPETGISTSLISGPVTYISN
jgi:hypothetical protein